MTTASEMIPSRCKCVVLKLT